MTGEGIVTMLRTIAEAIKEAGPEGIPSGHLYAALMGKFSSVQAYESFIGILIRSGIVRQSGHVLTFIGGVR